MQKEIDNNDKPLIPYAVVTRAPLNQFQPVDGVVYSFSVEAYDPEVLFRYLDNRPELIFSLYSDRSFSGTSVAAILPFFFLPGMHRINGDLWTASAVSGFSSDLANELELQGLSDYSHYSVEGHDKRLIMFESLETFLGNYPEILESGHEADRILLLADQLSPSLSDLRIRIRAIEQEYQSRFPQTYDLRCALQSVTQELCKVTRRANLLNTELQNFIAYNELLRKGHAAAELQAYYNEQYEVLPIWYKRVGHVIKIITGKRSVPLRKNIKRGFR